MDKPAFDPNAAFSTQPMADKPAFDPSAPFKASPDVAPAPTAAAEPEEKGLLERGMDAVGEAAPTVARFARHVPVVGPQIATAINNAPLIGEAVTNIPKSAAQFGHDLVQPILHPIDTATAIKDLGHGVLQKTGILGGTDKEKYADAVGKMLVDRYGSIEAVKRTFATDPVGFAADLSTVLTGGGALAARAPGALGKVGEAASAVGRAVDPLSAVAPVLKGTGKLASETIGLMSGVGPKAIETAAKAGYEGGEAARTLRDNMRGNVPMENVVADAQRALQQIRKDRGVEYRDGMKNVGQDQAVLDFIHLDDAFQEVGKINTYKGRDLSPDTRALREKLDGMINDWYALPGKEFHTAEGFDALKRSIGNVLDSTKPGTPDHLIAKKYYDAAKKTVVEQAPEYAKVMKGYEEASDIMRQIEKTLSIPKDKRSGPTIDTSLRKLQSVLRNNVNTNFGQRAKLAEYLVDHGSPQLMNALAGQALNAWAPRGLARIGSRLGAQGTLGLIGAGGAGLPAAALTAATLPTMSPRLMGEAAYGLGKTASSLKRVPVKPIARGLNYLGRATDDEGKARGGAIDRALRIAREKR